MDTWYMIEVATSISGERMDYFNGMGESSSDGLRSCKKTKRQIFMILSRG